MDPKMLKLAQRLSMDKKAFQAMGGQPPPQPGQPAGPGAPPAPGQPAPAAAPAPQGQPPPQGGDPMIQQMMQIMQDPQVQQALAQQGITMGQQGPTQNGQVVPPEQMMQILQQMGAMPPQGGAAPGGQPPPSPEASGMAPESMGAQDGQVAEGAPEGGMPPEASQGGQPPSGGQPLTMEAFMEIMPQMLEAYEKDKKASGGDSAGKEELAQRVDQLEQMVTGLVQQLGMSPASAGLGSDVTGMPAEAPAGMPAGPQDPEAVDAIQAAAGVPAGPQGGMPVTASEKYRPEVRRTNSVTRIQGVISKLKHAR